MTFYIYGRLLCSLRLYLWFPSFDFRYKVSCFMSIVIDSLLVLANIDLGMERGLWKLTLRHNYTYFHSSSMLNYFM